MSFATHPSIAAAMIAVIASPVPALAQESAAAELANRLGDPEEQQQTARTLSAVSEVVLTMPIAPLVEAVEGMTGQEMAGIAPGTTLRSLAGPRADAVSPGIERNVPRAMGAMAGMAAKVEAMLPAMRSLAGRMRAAMAAPAE